MDLLEYQAKELFAQVGIPVLPSQTIHHTRDLKQLQIPYPVVLKSQVRTGGRGAAGGVRLVENTIDAIAAASAIFNLSIAGHYPEVILAEAHYQAERELFLAVVLDYERQMPLLLGSAIGGLALPHHWEQVQTVPIPQSFSPFLARRLAIAMGLKGSLVLTVSQIIEQMFSLFATYDLELIEINPLGVSAAGELMALDGKIMVNDDALDRQPRLAAWQRVSAPLCDLERAQLPRRSVAVLSNGWGLCWNALDLLAAWGIPVVAQQVIQADGPDDYGYQMQQALLHLGNHSEIGLILCHFSHTPGIGEGWQGALELLFPPDGPPLIPEDVTLLVRMSGLEVTALDHWPLRCYRDWDDLMMAVKTWVPMGEESQDDAM